MRLYNNPMPANKPIEIILVGTYKCKGLEVAEKTLLEVLRDFDLYDRVTFKKIVYTGSEEDFDPPIFGSPTILINGVDLIYELSDLQKTTS